MKKIKIKAPAKINLTLDILGANEGYHEIKSLVASIDLSDTIILNKRKDTRVTLTTDGLKMDCDAVDNNAYKACRAFVEKYSTLGADIKLKKAIPIGAGLGGSSADIAGVLRGMKELYETGENLLSIANSLGSDSGYMLSGGYATISGRGEKIAKKEFTAPIYVLIITGEKPVSARASYKAFDKLDKTYKPCTLPAERALKDGDLDRLFGIMKNDLTAGSQTIDTCIKGNIYALKKAGAPVAIMTGSGSAVFGAFSSKKERDKAYKKLLPLFGNKLIKAKTTEQI